MKTYLKPFWFIYLILIFLPLGVTATLLCAIVVIIGCSIGDHKFWGYYPGMIWARFMCLLTFSPVKVEGRENISKNKSYVFAVNHESIYDVFLIYGYLGVPFKWILKKELKNIPFIGMACKCAGHIFINRQGGKQSFNSLLTAEEMLEHGISIVVFPEGKRTRDGKVGPFKRGAFHIASDLNIPIVPLSLSGCYRVMRRNRAYPMPGRLKLKIHQPVSFRPTDHDDEMNLISQIRDTIISGIE